MIASSFTNSGYTVISRHGIADVWHNTSTNQHALHAAVSFNPGDSILPFTAGSVHEHPTYLTVQTGARRHITLLPEFLQYINHSCDPNVFFDTDNMQLICVKAIKRGEEMRFFYPGTEWEMAQPFICNCGSSNCIQLINGAAHLSKETLSKYKLTNFIAQQLKQHTEFNNPTC